MFLKKDVSKEYVSYQKMFFKGYEGSNKLIFKKLLTKYFKGTCWFSQDAFREHEGSYKCFLKIR